MVFYFWFLMAGGCLVAQVLLRGLSASKGYYLKVSTCNVAGCSGSSPLSTILYTQPASAPSAVLQLACGAAYGSNLTFSWLSPVDSGGMPVVSYRYRVQSGHQLVLAEGVHSSRCLRLGSTLYAAC